jgi:hypothetical protein
VTDPLFRAEALEYLNRRSGPGELVQVHSPRLELVYLAFVTLILVATLAVLVIGVRRG